MFCKHVLQQGTEPLQQATGKMTMRGGLEKSGFSIEIR
jgi:hypothetical protein